MLNASLALKFTIVDSTDWLVIIGCSQNRRLLTIKHRGVCIKLNYHQTFYVATKSGDGGEYLNPSAVNIFSLVSFTITVRV